MQGAPSRHRPIPTPFSKQTASFGIYVSPQLVLTLLIPKLTPKLTVSLQVTRPLQNRLIKLEVRFSCFLV